MNRHIFEHIVDIKILFDIRAFAYVFKCGNDSFMIFFGRICDRTVPYGRIVVKVVAVIVKIGSASAHGKSTKSGHLPIKVTHIGHLTVRTKVRHLRSFAL